MFPSHIISIFIAFLSITAIWINLDKLLENFEVSKKYWILSTNSIRSHHDLVIGILSAQQNFAQRKAIRETWLMTLHNKTNYPNNNKFQTKALFIVGNESCTIPPEYRLNAYSCEQWKVNISEIKQVKSFVCLEEVKVHKLDSMIENAVYQGFSFQVNYPIILSKLGILYSTLPPNGSVSIVILTGANKEIILKTTFNSRHHGTLINGFIYRSVQPILLPKEYEGIILVEGEILASTKSFVKWNTGSGLISYRKIYVDPEDYNCISYSGNHVVAPSFIFSIDSIKELQQHVDQEKVAVEKWMNNLKSVEISLHEEIKMWNDIVLIDVIDVYRNLPSKVLNFFAFVSSNYNFSYILKTDDDCLVNLYEVIKELQTNIEFEAKQKNWCWSRFRTQWPVNYFGKWTDNEYTSFIYPAFPCGGGYVLSADIILWLSQNSKHLYHYQGEDVSVGIWMSALNPELIKDIRWSCNKNCHASSLSRCQLTNEEMYDYWKNVKECGNLCNCN